MGFVPVSPTVHQRQPQRTIIPPTFRRTIIPDLKPALVGLPVARPSRPQWVPMAHVTAGALVPEVMWRSARRLAAVTPQNLTPVSLRRGPAQTHPAGAPSQLVIRSATGAAVVSTCESAPVIAKGKSTERLFPSDGPDFSLTVPTPMPKAVAVNSPVQVPTIMATTKTDPVDSVQPQRVNHSTQTAGTGVPTQYNGLIGTLDALIADLIDVETARVPGLTGTTEADDYAVNLLLGQMTRQPLVWALQTLGEYVYRTDLLTQPTHVDRVKSALSLLGFEQSVVTKAMRSIAVENFAGFISTEILSSQGRAVILDRVRIAPSQTVVTAGSNGLTLRDVLGRQGTGADWHLREEDVPDTDLRVEESSASGNLSNQTRQ